MAIKTAEFDAFFSPNKVNTKNRLAKLRGAVSPISKDEKTNNESEHVSTANGDQAPKIKTEHKRVTNGSQMEHVGGGDLSKSFSALVGIQRRILYIIYQSSKKTRSHISEPLSIEHIAHAANVNQKSVKTSIFRLKEKGFIKLAKFKNGRGGWACYEIDDAVYKEIMAFDMEHKENTNGSQKEHDNIKLDVSTQATSKGSQQPISENHFDEVDFDKKWDLDVEPLAGIGFNRSHLKQIAKRTSLYPEDVQECIYAFAHDLASKSVKIKMGGSALNLFMGVLTKDTLYSPVSPNYVNPKVKTAELYLAKQREARQRYKELDDELRKDHFINIWSKTLSDVEKFSYLPDDIKKTNPPKAAVSAYLRTHHTENIWPTARESFYKEKNLPFTETYFLDE